MTKRLLRTILGIVLLTIFNTQAGFAQPKEAIESLTSELERQRSLMESLQLEINQLQDRQAAIQKEIEEIKKRLPGWSPPPIAEAKDVVLSVGDGPFKGDKNAKLTLIEFSDYQCPFCAQHFRETLPQIERDYIKTGKVKYVFRDFPIVSIHREAFKAAEAARCADDEGKYWEMHDRLFTSQSALGFKDLSLHAQAIGLDSEKFDRCLIPGKYASKIQKDIAEGLKAGVKGTPTFFLGITDPNDTKVKSLRVIRGAEPYTVFNEAIDKLLSSEK